MAPHLTHWTFDTKLVVQTKPVMQVKVEASWDSTVHECPQLSRVTPPEQRVYLTVKAAVQLSHPANMQLVLRKRICVSVIGRQVGDRTVRCPSAASPPVLLYSDGGKKER